MTAQISDNLIIDGGAVDFMGCPPLPWHDPRLVKLTDREAKRAGHERWLGTTACWRRYVATWYISDDRLYLGSIDGIYRFDVDAPVFADWVTQELKIVHGEVLHSVNMGFGSVFEREVFLNVVDGVVVGRTEKDNRGLEFDWRELSLKHLPTANTIAPGKEPNEIDL